MTKEVQSLFTLAHTRFALTNSLLPYVLTCVVEPPEDVLPAVRARAKARYAKILRHTAQEVATRNKATLEVVLSHGGVAGDQEAALRNRLDGTNSRGLSRTNSGTAAPPPILSRRTVKRHERVSVHERVCAVGRKTRRRAAKQRRSDPFGELLIGATELSLGFSELTENVRHFQKIPGLSVIQLRTIDRQEIPSLSFCGTDLSLTVPRAGFDSRG